MMERAVEKTVSMTDFADQGFRREIVGRCLGGDLKAMGMVYEAFRRPLFLFILRFSGNHAEAEDMLQDTFIKVFKGINRLQDPDSLKSWIYRIAVNTCLSHRRKFHLLGRLVNLQRDLDYSAEIPGARHEQPSQENYQLIQAIGKLSPSLRSVYLLHDVQGLIHEEIAGIMGWSEGTSKSQLFKARKKLRRSLGE
jgi:RNA polymerase sigma-70 factor, ECF subfamily